MGKLVMKALSVSKDTCEKCGIPPLPPEDIMNLDHEMANQDLQVPVEGNYHGLLLVLGDGGHHGDDVALVHGLIGRTNDTAENWEVASETQGTGVYIKNLQDLIVF